MMFLDPRWVRASKGEMEQERGPEKKQTSLFSDNVAGGKRWHNRKIKLKESKHEEELVEKKIKINMKKVT
jgi:hypothetical protein